MGVGVAIIGAGNVGRALATSFERAGDDVIIASRDPEDAGAVASAADVATEIRAVVAGKPVVDATNRMSFGPTGPVLEAGESNAEQLAAWLPEASVIKAFNTLFASNQADPIAEGIQTASWPATTPWPRPRSSSSCSPSACTPSTSGRSAAPSSWSSSPS